MSLDYPPFVQRPAFRRAYRLPFRSPAGIETIIANALADLNADDAVGVASVSEIPNSGLGGTGYDHDTPLGTPANGKPHYSGSCVFFGGSGDALTSPDSAMVSVDGKLTIIGELQLDSYIPASEQVIYAHYLAAGSQRAIRFSLTTAGKLRLILSDDGTFQAANDKTSSIAITAVAGAVKFVKLIWIPATGLLTFSTSDDGITFPQLGTTFNTANTSIHDSTTNIAVGAESDGASGNVDGGIHRVQIFDGDIRVSDMNAADHSDPSSLTFTSKSTGQVWTLVNDSYIQNTGHKALQSIGSYGLETTAGQDIAIFTRFVVGRFTDAAPGANQVIFDARSNAAKSVSLFSDNANSNKLTLDAGGTPIAIAGAYDTDLHVFTVISNGANSLLRVSGVGEVEGNPGSEVLDYGTILAALGSGSSAPFSYLRDLTFNSAISGARIAQIEDALAQTYKGVAV